MSKGEDEHSRGWLLQTRSYVAHGSLYVLQKSSEEPFISPVDPRPDTMSSIAQLHATITTTHLLGHVTCKKHLPLKPKLALSGFQGIISK